MLSTALQAELRSPTMAAEALHLGPDLMAGQGWFAHKSPDPPGGQEGQTQHATATFHCEQGSGLAIAASSSVSSLRCCQPTIACRMSGRPLKWTAPP